jgi:hypothetical protein
MVKRLALRGSVFEKMHKQKMRRNMLKSALKSFSNLKKQNTMDHSYVVNMAQE